VFAADDADVTASGDEWRRGEQVASLPERDNGPELRNGADHRALVAGRQPCDVPTGAAEGGPHAAH
jgi:hypothetical protein